MFNYKKYSQKATDRLTYYGQDITILGPDMTTVKAVKKAIASPIMLDKKPEQLVDNATLHITCESVDVTNDDYAIWNQEIYKVYHVAPVNLTNEQILVQFYLGV